MHASERRRVHRNVYTYAHTHTFQTNLFEKWQKFHTVITQLTAVILLFLISTSHKQCVYMHMCPSSRASTYTHVTTHTHRDSCIAPIASWQTHKIILTQSERTAKKQCWKKIKNSCVSTKQTAFLVLMKLQQQALMNTNTDTLDYKDVCSYGVILASETVTSISQGRNVIQVGATRLNVNIVYTLRCQLSLAAQRSVFSGHALSHQSCRNN